MQPISFFFSPKEAQSAVFRQKSSARNIAVLKCESRKKQMLGTMEGAWIRPTPHACKC